MRSASIPELDGADFILLNKRLRDCALSQIILIHLRSEIKNKLGGNVM